MRYFDLYVGCFCGRVGRRVGHIRRFPGQFGYALRGSGYIAGVADPALSGYIVDVASGTGGQRMEFHLIDSGAAIGRSINVEVCEKFSAFNVRKIAVEIDSGSHRVTWTFDTGAMFDKSWTYRDTMAYSILSRGPTKLQLVGQFSANWNNMEGKIYTDTWLAEAMDVKASPLRPARGRR